MAEGLTTIAEGVDTLEYVNGLAREAWGAGYTPCAIRVNKQTEAELRKVLTRFRFQGSSGSLTLLETPFGNLRVVVDDAVPDTRAILQVEFKWKGL
jgi:hypothetical protein